MTSGCNWLTNLGSDLTGQVIGSAIAVHREFGPGLDEADYERALHLELLAMGIEHVCQVPLPLIYKGTKLDCGYRMDLVVAVGCCWNSKSSRNCIRCMRRSSSPTCKTCQA